jgi:carbonic anhydrase/acetyltransferase-like protein (isoleucine patch superfamily)
VSAPVARPPSTAPPELAATARVAGQLHAAPGTLLAQGAVVRGHDGAVELGHDSALLELGVVVGRAGLTTRIGRRVVFGHRAVVVGATVGDLCEVGNGTVLMSRSVLGEGCMTGEGAVVPAGVVVPPWSVLVGRPARVARAVSPDDRTRLAVLRGGDLSLHDLPHQVVAGPIGGADVGTLHEFRGTLPTVAPSARLLAGAEVTGDVVIGDDAVLASGVKVIGDSHGPVRIGARVQILENTVLHLLPDGELVLEDDVVIGPGCTIHGCHIGAGTVVEPGAIVCDHSRIGPGSIVRAGACVKQRTEIPAGSDVDGFPARVVGTVEPPGVPPWAFLPSDLVGVPTQGDT